MLASIALLWILPSSTTTASSATCPASQPATRGELPAVEYLEEDLPRSARARYDLDLYDEQVVPRGGPFSIPEETPTIYGVDISHWQGSIDWSAVPDDGVTFAVAKATQGEKYVDRRFENNWAQMAEQRNAALQQNRANFFRGAYHFFEPQADPLMQAEHFIRTVGQLEPGDLPPTLDLEWDWANLRERTNDRWDAYTPEQRVACVIIWLDRVEQELGRTPIIYTNFHFWREKFGDVPDLTSYPLWIADYSTRSNQARKPVHLPPGFATWMLWQFTDNGRVEGVQSAVDVNRFNGTHPELTIMAALTDQSVTALQAEIILKRGAQGPEVETLQDRLIALGYMTVRDKRTGPGIFGPRTEAAVKEFQSHNYLTRHGMVDRPTQIALDALAAGVEQGATGDVVRSLHDRLMALGFLNQAQLEQDTDRFGSATEAALKAFQQARDLPMTGILDPASYRVLHAERSRAAPPDSVENVAEPG